MLKAKLIDRKTTENVMNLECNSLTQLKEKIITLIENPENLLIMVGGMNPFLFIDFNIVLGEYEEEEVNMNIEQKLAYIRKALELGANVELNFHNLTKEEEAEKAVTVLGSIDASPYSRHESQGTKWFKIRNHNDRIYTTVFFDEPYLKEDVDLSGSEFVGGEKHVS